MGKTRRPSCWKGKGGGWSKENNLLNINYAEVPENNPPVLLQHGGSANWQYYEGLIGALSSHWHVYALDLRGHGKSGRIPWGYSLREFAADTGAFLQQVSGPAALFGHSLGGIVAVMTAALYQQDVRALLVGDAPLDARNWQARMQGQRETQQHWRELSGGKYSVDEIIAGLKNTPVSALGPGDRPQTMRDIYPDDDPVYEHLALKYFNIIVVKYSYVWYDHHSCGLGNAGYHPIAKFYLEDNDL